MRQMQGRTSDRVGGHAVEVPRLSWLWLAAATLAGATTTAGSVAALVWLAGVGGWLRFLAAVLIVGVAAPSIWRTRLDDL